MAGVLIIVSVALMAALTIGTSASFNVGLLQHSENARTASLLADSAIQQAIAELMRDPLWGSNAATDRIAYSGPVEDSQVTLTFEPSGSQPYSTNNASDGPVDGWPRARLLTSGRVPAERVHLVAVARCRNLTRTREAVIHVPSYTVSLASTGKVTLNGSLVGSLKQPNDLDNLSSDPELLGPGDLATNSDDALSVTLSSGSRVTGNVQSRGNVTVESGSTVGGEVRPQYSAADIPIIDIDEYDPARRDPDHPDPQSPLIVRNFSPGMHGHETVTGLSRCSGSTSVNGDLTLDNCLFFVDGNLTVTGAIRGQGAVIVKGNTRVEGGATVASNDNIALLSRGDVTLDGSASVAYTFQGMIYTQGNFTARHFTVVGAFIAASDTPGNGNVDLHGTRIFHTPVATQVDIYLPFQQTLQFASVINDPTLEDIPIAGGNAFSYGRSPIQATGSVPPGRPVSEYETPALGAVFNNPAGSWDWWNPAALEIRRESDGFVYELRFTEGGAQAVHTFGTRAEAVNFIVAYHQTHCPGYHDGKDADGNDYPEEGDTVAPSTQPGFPPGTPDPGFLEIWDPVLNNYRPLRVGDPNPLAGLRKDTTPYVRKAWELKLPQWERKNKITSQSATEANFSFDPNRFLKLHDKVRLSTTVEYSDNR